MGPIQIDGEVSPANVCHTYHPSRILASRRSQNLLTRSRAASFPTFHSSPTCIASASTAQSLFCSSGWTSILTMMATSSHDLDTHTGSSAFLGPPPMLSNARCIYGPTTGILPANPPIVEKKSPNSTKIPYSSTRKPTSGHRNKMSSIPATNAAVPLSFCRRAKKTAVFCRPIMRVRPRRKRICTRDY